MNHTSELARHVAAWPRPVVALRVTPLALVFGATLFTSAALLFILEPMFAKMVLPYFGGSPAVWNTCVMFFQAAMLAGYGYAHLTTRWLALRRQAALHILLALGAAVALPVMVTEGWAPPVGGSPVMALLLVLLVSIGGPFFIVSSTAPLLQRWFSQTDDPSARDPYFLYAASNGGSIVALLAYPLLIEPRWSLSSQSALWTVAYLGFAVLTMACAVGAIVRPGGANDAVPGARAGDGRALLSWRRRASWVALAFVPSSLLLGVTTFLSTDVAAMPLIWTVPLALYLLTFVIAFGSRSRERASGLAGRAVPVLALVLIATALLGVRSPIWAILPLHLAGFFVCALALHRRLADGRPEAHHLTEFYLWIAGGGLLGGIFNTLLAPLLFSTVAEYPLALALAVALRGHAPARSRRGPSTADIALPLVLGAGVAALLLGVREGVVGTVGGSLAIGFLGALLAACARRPARLGAALVLAVLAVSPAIGGGDLLYAERTFFGVLRVAHDGTTQRHRLLHGSTLHGEQSIDAATRAEPLTYYHRSGPIGQTIEALSTRLQRVAVVGLGAGSLAAYAAPDQRWTFFEIDPAVERIARDPRFFTYLRDCGAQCDVVLGDARLSLARTPARYDLIVLDAFSSDAIPAHLVTREALALYLNRLTEEGVLAFHVSNRHLDLRPVIGSLAADRRLVARAQRHDPEPSSGATSSLWVVIARDTEALGSLAADSRWVALTVRSRRVWTDDYSDVLSTLGAP